jgi:cell division septal protein FtsQ
VNDGSQDWDYDIPSSNANAVKRRRRLVIIMLAIAIILVLSIGVYVVAQTWDLWFVDSDVTVSESDQTATASCENFIAEFPGTPCPP